MPKYQIVNNRIKLSDERFDHYLDESLSFFSKLESIAGNFPPLRLRETEDLMKWRIKRYDEIHEAISNCRHKIQAVNYSLSVIDSEIKLPPIIGQRVLPIQLDETEFLDDVILFEFESFLFQIMSTLDVFAYLLMLFYPSLNSGSGRIGFKGEKGRACKATTKILKTESQELATYIDDQVDVWIQRVYDLRNTVVHKSKVHSLQMFLIDQNGIHPPTLSDDGMDLLLFCKDTYDHLKKFLLDIENDFLLPQSKNYYTLKND